MSHPYQNANDYQYWRKAVSNKDLHEIDLVIKTKFKISSDHKVATIGSCFAQNISFALVSNGFNYFITEKGEQFDEEERKTLNYGTFSARYGNVYTTRQLLQIFREAFDEIDLSKTQPWLNKQGQYFDPFRPQIQPEGFINEEELKADRELHLQQVRKMFEETDVLVFTLGTTEAWLAKEAHIIYPLAPGVVAGEYDENSYQYTNFNYQDVESDLSLFIDKLKKINPKVKVIITVSPIPLIATYEDKHIVPANNYCKSVLRVAAESVCNKYSHVDYFPSYEMVVNTYNLGRYHIHDRRGVNPIGVKRIMRSFLKNYTNLDVSSKNTTTLQSVDSDDVICDEEIMDAIKT